MRIKLLIFCCYCIIALSANAQQIIVNSIEDLKKQGIVESKTSILVLGYYSQNDGGGGVFYWDPESTDPNDDGLTIESRNKKKGRYKRLIDNFINAKWFGCMGNGRNDDSKSLKESIYKAQILGKDLFIPSGEYLCNTPSVSPDNPVLSPSYWRILYVDNSCIKKIRIYGEAGTKIRTNFEGVLLSIYNRVEHSSVENIWFESTHELNNTGSTAIRLTGLGGMDLPAVNSNPAKAGIRDFKILNCRFTGFHSAIQAMGVDGLTIDGCFFEAPFGHDNSTNTTLPACFVTFHDNNKQGACWNVIVNNCIADGFTGSDLVNQTRTKKCMDGFILGPVYGFIYTNNITRNLQEEHVLLLLPNGNNPGDFEKPILIHNNIFYGKIPEGAIDAYIKDELKKVVNLVRCDAHNAEITGNQFYDATAAVLIRPYDQASAKGKGYRVADNKFRTPNDLTGKYQFKYCINIQGFNNDGKIIPAEKIVVTDNFMDIDSVWLEEVSKPSGSSRAAIQIYDAEKVVVDNNKIFISNAVINAHALYGIIYGRIEAGGLTDSRNYISGAPSGDYKIDGSISNIKWLDYSKKGTFNGSGKGQLIIEIKHNLGVIPTHYVATAASRDAKNISYVTADFQNLYIYYDNKLPKGNNNIVINWQVSR